MIPQAQSNDDYWQTLPLGRGVTICATDDSGLVAFSKPAGILSHPNTSRLLSNALLSARYNLTGEYYEWTTGGTGCQSGRQDKTHGIVYK